MNTLDTQDLAILTARAETWNKRTGPRVGDFIRMLDGTVRRFTHDWGDGLQTTVGPAHPCAGDESFYFGTGGMSFSGSLDDAIPVEQIKMTTETRDGNVWIFHHDQAAAHNGVTGRVTCRVYEQVPASSTPGLAAEAATQ